MKNKSLWALVVIWGIACLCGSHACQEQERVALLALNVTLDLIYRADVEGSYFNCCSWEGVECNPTTGQVTHLILYDSRSYRFGFKTWYLNASLLLPFEELKSLDLSNNYLGGWIAPEEPNLLSSRLSKLKVLYLSGNSLDNSILSILGIIPSLRSLFLSRNNLSGTLLVNEPNLLFSRLSKLEVLDLSGNSLDNSILSILGTIPSLQRLFLSGNNLSGTLHVNGGCSNLMELDISDNAIDAVATIEGDLSNLKELDISYNAINAVATIEGIKNLSHLENLHLDGFHLKHVGTVVRALGALSSLRILSLQYITIEGTIITQVDCWLR